VLSDNHDWGVNVEGGGGTEEVDDDDASAVEVLAADPDPDPDPRRVLEGTERKSRNV
jgi:hypothetical protein